MGNEKFNIKMPALNNQAFIATIQLLRCGLIRFHKVNYKMTKIQIAVITRI